MARTKQGLTGANADPDNPLLDVGPFREWLIQQRSILGNRTNLARTLGVSERQIDRWLYDADTNYVSLDSVDCAGCAVRNPMLLRTLYPETYRFPEWLDGDEVAL